ncbi:TonB-dependent receptor [Flammeovirga yaeyamensis]|uniref:TonB-dependent receptor n=1 Tax=Flammeovirga yaeyamensis TaxID=367791 RepID=A0AAX1N7A5_9BACT|nr:outer membrane beta-barrel family protein [Flammeovirga yaeyamensis]MBB3697948.1 hypothetical protein [Flammeovirga yaeyamensis]NMF35698.1 TonB-dependent receptor [Flammeovirga yaeyamensis]QWG03349.1 TonB-dependent receptor [Flammeovirga yaeyamensis]
MLRRIIIQLFFLFIPLFSISQNLEEAKKQDQEDDNRYFIGKDIKIVDGNAIDALRLIPSVDVDADGIVSYRGNTGVQVFINNRPASQSGDYGPLLEQIFIQDIKYIEIIANPSARYDADGTAGIINLEIDRKNMNSTTTNVMLGVGNNDKYDAGLGFSKNTGKLSINAGYNYKQENRYQTMDAELLNFDDDYEKATYQDYYGDNFFEKHNFQVGGQYDFNDQHSLSLSSNFAATNFYRGGTLATEEFEGDDHTIFSQYNNHFGEKQVMDNRIDYVYKTNNDGELATSLAWATGQVEHQKNIGEHEINDTDVTFNDAAFQLDYQQKLKNGMTWEAGVKQTYRNKTQGLMVYDYSENKDGFLPNEDRSNVFTYNEYVSAAYLMLSGKKNKFSYQLGVRGEYTYINTYLETDATKNVNDYFNLYPSINLKQGLSEHDHLYFSYTRKVERPSMRMINPFEDTSNPNYIHKGNPNLDATFLDIVELGYGIDQENYQLKFSTFYKYYTDPARWYTFDGEGDYMVNTVINMDHAIDAGVEVVGDVKLLDWWNVNGNFTVFYSEVDGTSIDPGNYQQNVNWRTSLTSSMELWKGSQLQMQFTYISPSFNPQGTVDGRYFMKASLSQSVNKGQGSLILTVDDILDSQHYTMYRDQPTFSEHKVFEWESKVVRLMFRYRIGGGNQKGPQKAPNAGMDANLFN